MRGRLVTSIMCCWVLAGCARDAVTPPGSPVPDANLNTMLARYTSSGLVAVGEIVSPEQDVTEFSVLVAPPRNDPRTPVGRRMDFQDSDLAFIVNPAQTGGNTITINWSFYCYNFSNDTWVRLNQLDIHDAFQEAQANSGGHGGRHPLPAKPVGTWNPKTGATSGGVFTSTFTAGVASGDELITFKTTVHDPGDCQGPTDFYALSATRFRGLQLLTGHVFGTITSDHASVFYATGALAGHATAANGFYRQAAGASFTVTAASLIYGGINDVNFNWRPPHQLHRVGTDLDIDGSADNQRVWDRLIRAGARGGFRRCEVHNRNHVHCYD